jgi:hypothetical protein
MDLITYLLTLRTPAGYHVLGMIGFGGVLWMAVNLRPTQGRFLAIRTFYFILAVPCFVAGVSEIYFNAWFAYFYGIAKTPLWIFFIGAVLLGMAFRVHKLITPKQWVAIFAIQTAFMVPWALVGLPVSSNADYVVQIYSLNPYVNALEDLYYVLWTFMWTWFLYLGWKRGGVKPSEHAVNEYLHFGYLVPVERHVEVVGDGGLGRVPLVQDYPGHPIRERADQPALPGLPEGLRP